MGVQVKQGHYPTKQMYLGDKFTLYTDTVTTGAEQRGHVLGLGLRRAR